jgi:hypothetical protein
MDGDAIDSQIGDAADTVAAGKNIRQSSIRDSHDTYMGASSELLQMSVDIRLLQNMVDEQRIKLITLQGWVIMIGMAIFLQTISFVLLIFYLVWR